MIEEMNSMLTEQDELIKRLNTDLTNRTNREREQRDRERDRQTHNSYGSHNCSPASSSRSLNPSLVLNPTSRADASTLTSYKRLRSDEIEFRGPDIPQGMSSSHGSHGQILGSLGQLPNSQISRSSQSSSHEQDKTRAGMLLDSTAVDSRITPGITKSGPRATRSAHVLDQS